MRTDCAGAGTSPPGLPTGRDDVHSPLTPEDFHFPLSQGGHLPSPLKYLSSWENWLLHLPSTPFLLPGASIQQTHGTEQAGESLLYWLAQKDLCTAQSIRRVTPAHSFPCGAELRGCTPHRHIATSWSGPQSMQRLEIQSSGILLIPRNGSWQRGQNINSTSPKRRGVRNKGRMKAQQGHCLDPLKPPTSSSCQLEGEAQPSSQTGLSGLSSPAPYLQTQACCQECQAQRRRMAHSGFGHPTCSVSKKNQRGLLCLPIRSVQPQN